MYLEIFYYLKKYFIHSFKNKKKMVSRNSYFRLKQKIFLNMFDFLFFCRVTKIVRTILFFRKIYLFIDDKKCTNLRKKNGRETISNSILFKNDKVRNLIKKIINSLL